MIPEELDPLYDANGGVHVMPRFGGIIWKPRYFVPDHDTHLLRTTEELRNGQPVIQAIYLMDHYCCKIVAWFDLAGTRI